ncbi:hypothetical protein BDC45DRAFT_527811 [Circinella umbellata]|nr:hypothetical protein BDC45DRAFT_527811 [Circinella umbellata]
MSIKYEAVITSLLIVHNQKSKVVPLRLVLDDLIHVIISSASSNQSNEVLKGIWINRIESCAKKANITLQKNDWLCSCLNPNNFWVLDATKRAAAAAGPDVNPLSKNEFFILNAVFAPHEYTYSPSYSMILDVDEENWKTVFTKEELMEIQNEGSSLIRQTPDELLDIYTYAYSLPHDPTKDHLLTWWSLTLLNAANQFLCENTGTERVGEADTMYNNWSFLSTIFRGSNIQVHGKELGSQANAFAQNAKRKISAIDEVEKAKRGTRFSLLVSR